MKPKILSFPAVAFAATLLAALPAQAQMYYTSGHGDIGIAYTPGEHEFEAHWHIGGGATVGGSSVPLGGLEYAPSALIAQLFTQTTVTGVIANALGVSDGSSVYRMGNNTYQPNLGLAAEEIGPETDWDNDGYITMALVSFSGPGAMVIAETSTSDVIFASLGNEFTDNDNQWELFAGDHRHLHWFFTEAGAYDVTFEWAGRYIGAGEPMDVTGTGSFGIQADAIPEPGTWAMLLAGAGAVGLAFVRRRRQAASH